MDCELPIAEVHMWRGELTIPVTHIISGWDPKRGCAASGEARGFVKGSVATARVRTEQGAVTEASTPHCQ